MYAIPDMEPTKRTLCCYFYNRRANTCAYKALKEAGKLDHYEKHVVEALGLEDAGLIDVHLHASEPEEIDNPLKKSFKTSLHFLYSKTSLQAPIEELIELDATNFITYDYDVIQKVIDRCLWLMKNHLLLWIEVLSHRYEGYFQNIYNHAAESTISKDLLMATQKVFPSLTVDMCLDEGPVRAYNRCLGFSPDIDEDVVMERYVTLKNEEVRKNFVLEQRTRTKTYMDNIPNLRNDKELASLEPLENFYVENLVLYVDERGFSYLFTLPECKMFLQSGLNPYNNLPFTAKFLGDVILKTREIHHEILPVETTLHNLYHKEELNVLIEHHHSYIRPIGGFAYANNIIGMGGNIGMGGGWDFQDIHHDSTRQNIAKIVMGASAVMYSGILSWRMMGGMGFGLLGMFTVSCALSVINDNQINHCVSEMKRLVGM